MSKSVNKEIAACEVSQEVEAWVTLIHSPAASETDEIFPDGEVKNSRSANVMHQWALT